MEHHRHCDDNCYNFNRNDIELFYKANVYYRGEKVVDEESNFNSQLNSLT